MELNKVNREVNDKFNNIDKQTEKLRSKGARYKENINVQSEQIIDNKICLLYTSWFWFTTSYGQTYCTRCV